MDLSKSRVGVQGRPHAFGAEQPCSTPRDRRWALCQDTSATVAEQPL
ncbi:hypothetical protein [Streptomyces sp. NPDC002133]